MKLLISALFSLSVLAILPLEISSGVFKNKDLSFKSHTKSGRFGSYLVMDINYPPVRSFFKKVEKLSGKKLKNRGEAHITVITPVEYFDTLKDKVSIQEINKIAKEANIQEASFNIICLGEGRKGPESTYYIVVHSEGLLSIRESVAKLYRKRGGKGFNPLKFYPHITLGFTKRDLHESDGIIKDQRSCISEIVTRNK